MSSLFLILFILCFALFVTGLFDPEKSLFWSRKERTKKKSESFYGPLIIIFLLLSFFASDKVSFQTSNTGTSNENKTNIQNMTVEQKLAILDAETYVEPTDLKVLRINALLNDLVSMYNESKESIADNTSKAKGVLHDRGIKESCLNILEGMRKAGKVDNTTYKEAVTLFIMTEDYYH